MKYSFGSRLRYYRELRGISQKELASKIGVSNARVSNWEQGLNRPDVDILAAICAALQITADDLLDLPSSESEESLQKKEVFEILNGLTEEQLSAVLPMLKMISNS